MRYQNILRTMALPAVAACALILGACKEESDVLPTLDVKPGSGDTKVEQMRLISYNIQEGMKVDKDNNFDNFVAWVTAQAPDLFAIEETNNLTQLQLEALAKRWGHDYAVICKETGYPVALTSKYPIELVNRMLTGAPLHHGALHLKVRGINIVVLHLYPFGTYPNGTGPAGSGEAFRVQEMEYILEKTIQQYPKEQDWLMMGDFNSYSPLDDAAYQGKGLAYDVHNKVLASGYWDTLRQMHDYFISSTQGGAARIDYIYGSKSILRDITHAGIIRDAFTSMASDHLPCLLEFRHYPEE